MSDSLLPFEPQPARLLCLWDFPGKNMGVDCHCLLQGIFLQDLTQGSNQVSCIAADSFSVWAMREAHLYSCIVFCLYLFIKDYIYYLNQDHYLFHFSLPREMSFEILLSFRIKSFSVSKSTVFYYNHISPVLVTESHVSCFHCHFVSKYSWSILSPFLHHHSWNLYF